LSRVFPYSRGGNVSTSGFSSPRLRKCFLKRSYPEPRPTAAAILSRVLPNSCGGNVSTAAIAFPDLLFWVASIRHLARSRSTASNSSASVVEMLPPPKMGCRREPPSRPLGVGFSRSVEVSATYRSGVPATGIFFGRHYHHRRERAGRSAVSLVRSCHPSPVQQLYPSADGHARGRPDGQHLVVAARISLCQSCLSPARVYGTLRPTGPSPWSPDGTAGEPADRHPRPLGWRGWCPACPGGACLRKCGYDSASSLPHGTRPYNKFRVVGIETGPGARVCDTGRLCATWRPDAPWRCCRRPGRRF